MNAPLVSVIIPLYNAEHYIEQAVRSVLAQTLAALEVVVVDDHSTDGSLRRVQALAAEDARVRWLQTPANGGPGRARNLGMDAARGEWISMLDADDWYDAGRLQQLLDAARQLGLAIAADNQRFITDAAGGHQALLTPADEPSPQRLGVEDYLEGDRIHRTSRNLGLLKPMIRRDLLQQHGIRYDDERRRTIGEDFYFLLECMSHGGGLAYVSRPLYNYRTYDPNMLTKQLDLESYHAWREMHGRYEQLFDPGQQARASRLMQQRGRDIEQHIQFRRLVEPLKRGRLGEFVRVTVTNPKSILLLLRNLLEDPAALLLTARYLFRSIRHRLGT
ncbi:MAG: hypothetical protein CML06_12210 [Pseudomonadales bacterium]|nr:hypothetical protein [Pseudomonadales bacterium]